uniref:Uncharacterized protein n=1 Tax=Macrostomum lignano TaxID=282301 RepID=A0A1I8F5V7_9PLAT
MTSTSMTSICSRAFYPRRFKRSTVSLIVLSDTARSASII